MNRENTILEKLRPVSVVDERWPAEAREAALERLLREAATAPAPAPRRPGRRRLLLTAALTTGIVAAGAGVATASGLLPDSFTGPLSFWTSETDGAVDVQTARRVAQGPGPDGTVLSVWSGRGANGTVCVSPMFEAPGPIDRPAPKDFRLAGGQCNRPDMRPEPFGGMGGSATAEGLYTTWASAGDAVRADLRLADGSVRPTIFAEGLFFFWYKAEPGVAPPTLVGYDAAGAVMAETRLLDWDKLGR
jgi:hypothetical protein